VKSLSKAKGNCFEIAELPGGEACVRHSKHTDGLVLRFTPDEWQALSRRGVQQAAKLSAPAWRRNTPQLRLVTAPTGMAHLLCHRRRDHASRDPSHCG
jgi:hypothetical protein